MKVFSNYFLTFVVFLQRFKNKTVENKPQISLVLDFGNSFIKTGVFRGDELIHKSKDITMDQLPDYINKIQPEKIMISSVSIDEVDIMKKIGNSYKVHFLNSNTELPIQLNYTTVNTLGSDRIAGAAGAYKLWPGQNTMVLDAGTCLTYDFIDKDGIYQGGAISPGINMKFKALHTYTASLPLLEKAEEITLTGKSTEESILSGVIIGTCAEITEIIRMYQNKLPDLQLAICGGDAIYLSKRLHIGHIVEPDLVLIGLKYILDNNA
ncbi:MAG: type III pantothenate kinase [Cyclobacteriaceae bacterium]|nr:type III pantothenate kinase [Cyclobacteriaceae bacterium]